MGSEMCIRDSLQVDLGGASDWPNTTASSDSPPGTTGGSLSLHCVFNTTSQSTKTVPLGLTFDVVEAEP